MALNSKQHIFILKFLFSIFNLSFRIAFVPAQSKTAKLDIVFKAGGTALVLASKGRRILGGLFTQTCGLLLLLQEGFFLRQRIVC
jgi:hypothetical protein